MASTAHARGRRCRLRFSTLIRWLRYFENDPVAPEEFILRTIPNVVGYYTPDAPDVPVHPNNFEPNKKRDPDRLSFFRFDFVSPKVVALDNRHASGVFVAMLRVRDLLDLNLSVQPSIIVDGLPGHVIVPELNYSNYKANKKALKPLQIQLAKLASARIVYGPTASRIEPSR